VPNFKPKIQKNEKVLKSFVKQFVMMVMIIDDGDDY
jgi:hypothetical protein